MLTAFQQARLKIQWADHHIIEANRIISGLSDLYRVSIEPYGQDGQAVQYELPAGEKIGIDVALIVGDALHNLRTALDYAWVGAITKHAPAALSERPQFPVYPKLVELEKSLDKRKVGASSALGKRVISDIKPYEGGNNAIYRLHKLDISDKHKLLIPLIYVASVDGLALEDERGHVETYTLGVTRPGPYVVPLEGNWKIKDKGKLTSAVIFGNGLSLEGMDVTSLLFSFSIETIAVLNLLEYF